jgi:hypothetical protein
VRDHARDITGTKDAREAKSRTLCHHRLDDETDERAHARRPLMIDGFNQGWIDFADHRAGAPRARTTIDEVIADIVNQG